MADFLPVDAKKGLHLLFRYGWLSVREDCIFDPVNLGFNVSKSEAIDSWNSIRVNSGNK